MVCLKFVADKEEEQIEDEDEDDNDGELVFMSAGDCDVQRLSLLCILLGFSQLSLVVRFLLLFVDLNNTDDVDDDEDDVGDTTSLLILLLLPN